MLRVLSGQGRHWQPLDENRAKKQGTYHNFGPARKEFSPARLMLALAFLLSADSPTTYARLSLLIEAPDLMSRTGDFWMQDVRPVAKYQAGHIPGAIRVDPEQWAKEFAQQRDP
jgi:hypothetical protein